MIVMNKRKIEITQLKKLVYKGKKMRTITVKYETVLAYFKQKDAKDLNVFHIAFPGIINDLLNQLATTELVDKLENQSKEPLRAINTQGCLLKLESFELKSLSKEFPIQEICGCLVLEGAEKRCLSIQRSKLMNFFKQMRSIYCDFCYCAGEKIIVQGSELKTLYELFQAQWNKYQEKGRLNALERLERKICRSLYFIGVLIENNILEAIETAERRKREEDSDCGTRSEHKKNIKGFNQQVSTVHTFSSLDPSNLSVRLKSQTSQQEHFPISRNNLSNYSEKSEKIVSRSRYDLWDKAELKQLKFKLSPQHQQPAQLQSQTQKYQINYLSNDVQNILIEQAFKIQKLFTSSPMEKPGHYMMVDYQGSPPNPSHLYQQQSQYNNYYMQNYYPYSYGLQYPAQPQPYLSPFAYHTSDVAQLGQLKRSLGCLNLVQTRKKDIDRYQ